MVTGAKILVTIHYITETRTGSDPGSWFGFYADIGTNIVSNIWPDIVANILLKYLGMGHDNFRG